MKFLVPLIVVLVVLWLLRSRRRGVRPDDDAGVASKLQPTSTEPMVRCEHCGLHLPRTDALPGRGGVFCGEAHRTAFERAQEES